MGGTGNKITRTIINAAIFILMEVAALELLASRGTVQNFFISRAVHTLMAKAWGVEEDIRSYFMLSRVNDSLALENLDLRRQLSALEALEDRPGRDSLFAGLSDGFTYTPAKIVKMSRNKQHNYMILDKGSRDGVRTRTGVVTPDGVVGIVDAVGKKYSFAVSMMNTDLSVSARIGVDGAVGPLRWDGKTKDGAVLEEISLQYKFAQGDTVYTSGFSSLFPAGIPLGTVEDSRIVNGATYYVSVRLMQDYSTLRWVSLVRNEGEDEIEQLEKMEEDKR